MSMVWQSYKVEVGLCPSVLCLRHTGSSGCAECVGYLVSALDRFYKDVRLKVQLWDTAGQERLVFCVHPHDGHMNMAAMCAVWEC